MTRFESYLNSLQRFGIQPGLERVRALLEQLGTPQSQYPLALIGGTNGKGSTCEFLAKLLAAEQRTVGLYTSPHLYRWNERLRVLDNSAPVPDELFAGAISDADLDALFDAAWPAINIVTETLGQPTEFETLTALGLWHFQRAEVDVAVVEVGLGGRWDATNVTEPTVSVITHVALDHCDRLGDTLEAIAADKVEIARPNRILVTAETKPPVLQVFQTYCVAHQVRFWPFLEPDWSNDGAAMTACLTPLFQTLHNFPAQATAPEFQTLNFHTALVAQAALAQTLGWPHPSASGATPFSLAVPGRAEVLRQEPLTLIDGANNPDGAAHLAQRLREQLKQVPGRRLILVLGILADKDYAAMVQQLAPLAAVVIATQSPSPRAALAETIAQEARTYCSQVEAVTPVPAAVERALALAAPSDLVCITGSFYTIAEVERSAGFTPHPRPLPP